MSVYEWVSLAVIVATSLFGGIYFTKFKAFVRELRELVDVFDDALQDDSITKEEWKQIVKEALDLLKFFVKK